VIVELSRKVPPFPRLREGKQNCNIFYYAALKHKLYVRDTFRGGYGFIPPQI
jgi:hypothetical protein